MIITISRMFGSGGSEVAGRVATTLGWTLVDNAVVDSVAERLGMSPAEVSSLEERVPSFTERIAASMRLSTPEYVVPVADASLTDTAEMRVVDMTKRVMQEAVQRGNAVLVGRGAQVMLADRPEALHVFCYAASDALVKYAIAHRGIDPATAAHEVEKRNRQREQYVKRNWGRDWRRFENYHLCVDTGRLGIDAAAALVVAAARARFNVTA
ncbi:MAG TPA: cytidylate kinase-like family protein [Gemmatimonadaceae bacterium]|nr:cytidylate kinase-like family protein [Gemmatimonadaceae bacterium]